MATTLVTIRGRVATMADIANSFVLTDPQVDDLINESYRALWADVVDKNPYFRCTSYAFTLTTQQYVALPTGFRAVVNVQQNPGSATSRRYLSVLGPKSASQQYERTYRLEGSNLYIEPLQNYQGSYALLYTPSCPVLIADSDTLDAELDAFVDYIVYHAAVACGAFENSGAAQDLTPLFLEQQKKVQRWAANQRNAEPDKVENVRRGSGWGWFTP